MPTVIELSHKSEVLPKKVRNWSLVPEPVKAFLLDTDFICFTWNEMLVYKNHKMVASCTLESEIIELIDCWTTEGNLWKD